MLNRVSLLLLVIWGVLATSVVIHAQILGQQSLSQSSYVIDKDGGLWSWGWNATGQLGIGSTANQNAPVLVPTPPGVSQWTSIAGGARHALAVADSTKLYAWGFNGDGELGNGSMSQASSPVLIPNPSGVTAWRWVSAGQDHSMALATNGQLYAWGANAFGQLGTGDHVSYTKPHLVAIPEGETGWAAMAAGDQYTLAITKTGATYSVGIDSTGVWRRLPYNCMTNGPLPFLAAGGKNEIDLIYASNGSNSSVPTVGVAAGASHSSYLSESSHLICGGDNHFGQLGSPGDSLAFVQVDPPVGSRQWVAVAAGLNHSMAIASDGWLYSWGANNYGELGRGSLPKDALPGRVLSVCDSLTMKATLTGPDTWPGGPFDINLTDTNLSIGQTLSNTSAFLCYGSAIRSNGSSQIQQIAPALIPPGQSGTATWQMNSDSARGNDNTLYYYAYIRASGSAPLIVGHGINIPAKSWGLIRGSVHDSLTGLPLAGVIVMIQHTAKAGKYALRTVTDTLRTAADGTFLDWAQYFGEMLPFPYTNDAVLTFRIENYFTASVTLAMTADTLSPSVGLMPTPVVAKIEAAPTLAQAPAIFDKLFWVENTTIFGIAGKIIYRSDDAGLSWRSFASPVGWPLHDLFFRNRLEGWVVGGAGTILHTIDGGVSWTKVSGAGNFDLYGVCGVGQHLWIVGDGGVILHYRAGILTNETSARMSQRINNVYFLDSMNGSACAQTGIIAQYDSNNGWHSTGGGPYDLLQTGSCTPGYVIAAGTNGRVLAIDSSHSHVPIVSQLGTASFRSLQLLTPEFGYALGDSGLGYATYDRGDTWVPMSGVSGNLTSFSMFGVHGLAYRGTSPLALSVTPYSGTAIVHGRVTAGDHMTAVSGALITLIDADSVTHTAYSNETGNYVILGLPPGRIALRCVAGDSIGTFIDSAKDAAIANATVTIDFTRQKSTRGVTGIAPIANFSLSFVPNPVVEKATFGFNLAAPSAVRISLFDMLGREVALPLNGFESAGEHALALDARELPAGSYFIRIVTSDGSATMPIVVSR
ncbi:MAG: YCF48-related protein [Bacteroidota bacterium]|nr:YCF48-related protein [Bacteroidota bacterium]MDP4286800.1 YCF48-related protein [Bacteroidota bacterium]